MLGDFTKDHAQLVIDTVNARNGTALTLDSVTFGVPRPTSSGTTVRLELTAIQGKGYFGSIFVSYKRNEIATYIGERAKIFLNEKAVHVADVIDAINAAYQFNLKPQDYYNDILPVFSETSNAQILPFNLRIKPESLFFFGTVELILKRKQVALNQYILNTTLEGDIY